MNKMKRYALLLFLVLFLLTGCVSARQEAKIIDSGQKNEGQILNEDAKRELTGRAEAGESVIVMSKATGKAETVLVDVGSEVKQGQTLLQLDSRELQAGIDAARATVDNANVSYKYALDNEQRARKLKDEGAMSIADYDNGYASVLERAESAVNLAQASLEKAQLAYNDCTITAPLEGTITECNVEAGELVSPQVKAFTIVNLNQIKIELLVNEKKINSLKTGQKCEVTLAALPGQAFSGSITDISDAMNAASKAYPVQITVENPNHLIKDGMFAKVNLSANHKTTGGEE